MSPPDPRTEVAIKLLCEIHGWTEGDFAYFGDAPLHAKQVALITDALTTEAARVRVETWREAATHVLTCMHAVDAANDFDARAAQIEEGEST